MRDLIHQGNIIGVVVRQHGYVKGSTLRERVSPQYDGCETAFGLRLRTYDYNLRSWRIHAESDGRFGHAFPVWEKLKQQRQEPGTIETAGEPS